MTTRAVLTSMIVVAAALATTPDPIALWNDTAQRRPAAWLDPALRVPFASVLLGEAGEGKPLAPGDRIVGMRLPGDGGLIVPRGRVALLAAIAALPSGGDVSLWVQGSNAMSDRRIALYEEGSRAALLAQWPAVLAGSLLLLFAGVCAIGGRHPVATPLAAVTACLGTGILAALDLALPDDRGLLGVSGLRSRVGMLAWSLLPASLLHLSTRFPVTMPRFRRPALAALPWALWSVPAALAQFHFGTATVGHAVERVALAASFLAGGILIAGCLWPGRRLSPIERFRARAATLGLAVAGVGPFGVAVIGITPGAAFATALALGALALPIALGWAVARYRLLDPPAWLPRLLLGTARSLVALALAAALLRIAGRAVPSVAGGSALALATALFFQCLHPAFARAGGILTGRHHAPETLLACAARELAGAPGPDAVLVRLAAILRSSLGAGVVEVTRGHDERQRHRDAERSRPGSRTQLLDRSIALCEQAPAVAGVALVQVPRSEDPDPSVPEVALRLEPRGRPAAFVAVAPRPDGLPYSPDELCAVVDAGRLAALALADALDAERLERRVLERTAALRRALADRNALLTAAQRIQAAGESHVVRIAVAEFLAARSHDSTDAVAGPGGGIARVSIDLSRPPLGSERLAFTGLSPERAADLQPQADTLEALANMAIERLHLFDGLKLEVERQARELARIRSDRHNAEFVRRVAHELRKPGEEIRQLVAVLAPTTQGAARSALTQIESAACEMSRRLDTLLCRQRRRLDRRRVDLVRLVDEAMRRVALVRPTRRFEASHEHDRLPLLGDPVRLVSLIENLLDNAARATREAGRIAVRSKLLAPRSIDTGSRILLEVEDDGEGIPADLAEEIFEPGVGTFCGGFGLGLALCRDVVALHQGEIAVESQPGRTVFRVLLPQLSEEATA